MGLKVFLIFLTISFGGFLMAEEHLTQELILAETFGTIPNPVFSGYFKHQRLGRRVYGINASITINKDIGNDCKVLTESFRSVSGSLQFYKQPLGTAYGELPLEEFMNKLYGPFAMHLFENCSNFPQFKDGFKPPLKAGTYYSNNCELPDSVIPKFMKPGFYKFDVKFLKYDFGLRLIYNFSPTLS